MNSKSSLPPDLTAVSHSKSPLHPLLEAAQVNHRRYCESSDRLEQVVVACNSGGGGCSSDSAAWTIASLMRACSQREGDLAEPRVETATIQALAKQSLQAATKKAAPVGLTIEQEQQMLEKGRGTSVATFSVKFPHDLLHGEIESTDDRPAVVLARFELMVARQLAKSYLPSSVSVVDVSYDCNCDTLRFTLDPTNQAKERQSDDLKRCVDYLTSVIDSGRFWVEYPESNLNFCQPQEAQVNVTRRSAVVVEFSTGSTATTASDSATARQA